MIQETELSDLEPGCHLCWIVRDADGYVETAATLLRSATLTNEKPVAFGPSDSDALRKLREVASIAADPWRAFLNEGPLDVETMFKMFQEQSEIARSEGYRGLRVVADMDWLLPTSPKMENILRFELLLDRVVKQRSSVRTARLRLTQTSCAALAAFIRSMWVPSSQRNSAWSPRTQVLGDSMARSISR